MHAVAVPSARCRSCVTAAEVDAALDEFGGRTWGSAIRSPPERASSSRTGVPTPHRDPSGCAGASRRREQHAGEAQQPAGTVTGVGEYLPPAQWYASLPRFLASASALITDGTHTRVLAVKPNYRPFWNLPGGVMEADEPPHLCCAREVTEELGLSVPVGRLLVVDWVPPTDERPAWFGYIFDAGVLADPSSITLQADELDDHALLDPVEVRERMTENTANRIEAALHARTSGRVAYLHNGVPVAAGPSDSDPVAG